MSKTLITIIAVSTIVLVTGFSSCGIYVSYNRQERALRKQIEAVQENNKNEFELMWKKISQITQVTKAERESVEKIILGFADARKNAGGAFINAVKEALPNIDQSTFKNLQNIIVASRDRFAQQQTKLLDLVREREKLVEDEIAGIFIKNKDKIDVTIITSSKTKETFQTGSDDDVKLDL